MRARTTAAVACMALLFASACTSMKLPGFSSGPEIEERVDLLAVLPVESGKAPAGDARSEIDKDAEAVVTAAIYGALSSSYEWRFVPDLMVADALRSISPLDADTRRAQALGKAVNADAVIFGSVWRYVERVGTPANAESPASVGLTLRLLSIQSGEVVWEESYDATQETIGSSWFDWMLFWQEPPHWMTAAELTHVGVDRMIASLRSRLD